MVASTQSVSCRVSATNPVQSAASAAKVSQMIFFIAVVLRFKRGATIKRILFLKNQSACDKH
ncbi:hypothetical protein D3C80_2175020 [compost metagenome]